MRFRKITPCCSVSIVQITNTISTKDLIRQQMAGKIVSLPGGADSRSFDFPDGRTDWDKASIYEAPDLIEQSFMANSYAEHLNPSRPGNSPAAEPSPAPVVDSTPASVTPHEP